MQFWKGSLWNKRRRVLVLSRARACQGVAAPHRPRLDFSARGARPSTSALVPRLEHASSTRGRQVPAVATRHPHRPHACRARAAPPCALSPPLLSTPLPPRDSPTSSPATRPTPQTVTSQEPRQGRPWMQGAAEHYRRHFLRPFQLSEWNPRWARITPPPFPGQERPSPRRIPAIFIPVRDLDHIARSEVFLGAGTQNPGTCS
jgi:hypothetical protein